MNKKSILIIGDLIAFVILTLIGFATHSETDISFLPRMAAVFIPMVFSWFVLAPWLGLLDENIVPDPKQLLRIPLAFLFVAPLAVILRGAWLHAPVLPLFTLIVGGTNALGMMLWRWLYIFIAKRIK